MLEDKKYTLGQVNIYFTGRKDVYTWSINIYFTGRKDVHTGEKLIKLKKIKRIQLKLHVNYICSSQDKSGKWYTWSTYVVANKNHRVQKFVILNARSKENNAQKLHVDISKSLVAVLILPSSCLCGLPFSQTSSSSLFVFPVNIMQYSFNLQLNFGACHQILCAEAVVRDSWKCHNSR